MRLDDSARELTTRTTAIEYRLASSDWLGALRACSIVAEHFTELTADIAQRAHNEGATKVAVARALNVPTSAFRGMRRQGAKP